MREGKVKKMDNTNKMKMKFRAHETFFIRKGWLSKGMRYIEKTDGEVFVSKSENPVDILGLGTNMVKALRYWLVATELTTEETSGKRIQKFTDIGKLIYENDRFLEEIGTLHLLQYKLACSEENATAWYYFFNHFNLSDFDVNDFVQEIQKWIKEKKGEDEDVSKKLRSLTDDFNCIINTYFAKQETEKKSPENNIDCPLNELNLIGISNKQKKTYRKTTPSINQFNPYIALGIILDFAKEKSELQLNSLLQDEKSIGKIFNLDSISLIEVLRKVEKIGELKIIRTAGLDVIQLANPNMELIDCVKKYYSEISNIENVKTGVDL